MTHTQKRVLNKMRDGWRLWRYSACNRAWLSCATCALGVNMSTIKTLEEMGLIEESLEDSTWRTGSCSDIVYKLKSMGIMPKLSVDELTRRAFYHAEQDRSAYLEAIAHCNVSPQDQRDIEATKSIIEQLRNYRIKKWGKTALEKVLADAVLTKL